MPAGEGRCRWEGGVTTVRLDAIWRHVYAQTGPGPDGRIRGELHEQLVRDADMTSFQGETAIRRQHGVGKRACGQVGCAFGGPTNTEVEKGCDPKKGGLPTGLRVKINEF